MARAYQDAHILDNLSANVKTLQAATAELQKSRGFHEEKLKNLTIANQELAAKSAALEIRVKAK